MLFSVSIRAVRALVVVAAASAVAVLVACGADHVAAPVGTPMSLAIEAGDNQLTPAGQVLPQPLVVRVRDAGGRGVSGVTVRFAVEDGGVADPEAVVTDADGRASSRWTLGPTVVPGAIHRARAEFTYAARTITARFTARSGEVEPTPVGLRVLSLATYEGSGQTVHPDVIALPAALTGSSMWLMAVTPYPWGHAGDENPSVFTGLDGVTFTEPRARLNPVARPAAGHLSDPDVVYDPLTNHVRLYYREASSQNRIWLIESQGVTNWSAPRLVASGPNHSIISPAVVRAPNGEWRMYAIDGEGGCSASKSWMTLRRSNNGVDWSAPQRVSLDQPGFSPWHVDVQWIPSLGEYWAMYNAKTPGGCATTALYVATSTDGVQWTTYASPVLSRGAIREFNDIVYRASFHYDATRDRVTIWHSGARYESGGYNWQSAVETRTRASLFADVQRRTAARSAGGTPGAPGLVEWP